MVTDKYNSFSDGIINGFISLNNINSRIYTSKSVEEWLSVYQNRAEILATLRNSIEEFESMLRSEFSNLEPKHENYVSLFNVLASFHRANVYEPFLNETIFNILIPYFERIEDYNKLLYLYDIAAVSYSQMSSMGNTQDGKLAIEYFGKIIELANCEEIFNSLIPMQALYSALYNMVRVLPCVHISDFDSSLKYYKKFLEIRKKESFRKYDGNANVALFVNLLATEYPRCSFADAVAGGIEDEKVLNRLADMTIEACTFNGKLRDEIADPMNTTGAFYSYQSAMAYKENIDWDLAFRCMDEYYRKAQESINDILPQSTDKVAMMINPLMVMFPALKKSTLPDRVKHEIAKQLCDNTIKVVASHPAGVDSYALNMGISDLVFNKTVLELLKDRPAISYLLSQCVLMRHSSTFIHTEMVREIALLIYDEIEKQHPEYLETVKATIKDEDIRSYVSSAAHIHDIGKNTMIEIVVTEYRGLSNHEFQLLREHPSKGTELLKVTDIYNQYRDVILGHHRSYDGQSGYPLSFDNVHSPVKAIIDLITIADCMDAATDYLGRNYKRYKSFETVMKELRAGAGTMYNPYYVALIENTPSLWDALKRITGDDRKQIYYDIYRKHFAD